MFDFIKKYPYLTITALINLFVIIFFPLEIVTTLAITVMVFVAYAVGTLIVQLIHWTFSDEDVTVMEPEADEQSYRGSYAIVDMACAASPEDTANAATRGYTDDELTELADLTDRLKTLIEPLTTCDITLDTYEDPVVASDLHIYDNTGAYKCLIARGMMDSPYTRQNFLGAPFPFSFVKLKDLCTAMNDPSGTADTTIQKLLDLAICPVTQQIMENPKIAHVIYYETNRSYILHHFVLVCDQSALDTLPRAFNAFQLTSKVDLPSLEAITKDSMVRPKLEAALAMKPVRQEKNMTLAWKAAYAQAQQDFPTAVTSAAAANEEPAVEARTSWWW